MEEIKFFTEEETKQIDRRRMKLEENQAIWDYLDDLKDELEKVEEENKKMKKETKKLKEEIEEVK